MKRLGGSYMVYHIFTGDTGGGCGDGAKVKPRHVDLNWDFDI